MNVYVLQNAIDNSIDCTEGNPRWRGYPPFYPNGWLPIVGSDEVKPRQVVSLYRCGQQLVVLRDSRGVVHVFDAYCPHLGANLGVGATVEDNDHIRCPFHGWTFNSEGKCSGVAGLESK